MTKHKVNLIFYAYQKQHDLDDFRKIAQLVSQREPRIVAYVCSTSDPLRKVSLFLQIIRRPTLSIEMDRMKGPRAPRGPRLAHRASGGKLRQYELLHQAGIPVPRTVAVTEDLALNPREWGPYVVVKPNRGRRGAFVTIRRTGKVRYEPPESFEAGHPGRRDGMIAQQFIYTGPQPQAFRVLTYFGSPINCTQYFGKPDQPPLDGPDSVGRTGGISIVASATGCDVVLANDPEVLDLARRVHQTVPDIPSLGVDIVRDAQSGRLFVLEINPSGNSWSLSNPNGRKLQAEKGLDFYGQFNALDIIAERSIELTLSLAR